MNKVLFELGLLIFLMSFVACDGSHTYGQTGQGNPNHLINESSPYLLQHAYNPVDWYPWKAEALAKAKKEDKLLIISVGYAACHWCHVMEHESFEDSLVAALMNEHFVSIKVDREERPDIDDIYMTACHLSSDQGCGWPLNAIALPDGRPFYAGTYFPKENWLDLLKYFIKVRKEEPEKLETYAQRITDQIKNRDRIPFNENAFIFEKEAASKVALKMVQSVDLRLGGRVSTGNKFPMPNNYQYLLEEHARTNDPRLLEAVEITLEQMAWGGIYDQLGGGFARYSTDPQWKVPHFEKMLYDNGQLVSLYAQAYAQSKNPLYKHIVEESLAFIKRELTDETGGFYSSLDADSEGVEGKFYVWKYDEILAVLGEGPNLELFSAYYNVKKKGNWEHGNNVLLIKKELKEVAEPLGLSETKARTILAKAKEKLFVARAKRVRPGLDDKVLTAWNALMLKGYVDAYKALQNPAYLAAALKNAHFLDKEVLQKDFRLNRNYKDGKSVINAFLDDYALMIDAYVALYQVTFDEQWLEKAKGMADYVNAHFFDEETKMYFYTSDLDAPLIARKMDTSDNVIPSSNSAMAKALHLLGLYFYDNNYLDKAKTMMMSFSGNVLTHPQPSFFSNWASLYGHLASPPFEVAIVGKNAAKLRDEMNLNYLPNAILLGGKTEGALELLKGKGVEGETRIYVCQNKSCKLPVQEVSAALKQMRTK